MVDRLKRENIDAVQCENASILKARARALASKEDTEDLAGTTIDVVEFLINDEKYGIELTYIQEVYPLGELTEIPGVPSFVSGVVNVRGKIVSVNDIRKFFDIPAKGISDKTRIVILASASMEFGILADAILGARSIKEKDIVDSLPTLTGIRAHYLKGVTRDHTVILDGEKLLNDPEIVVK